MDGRASPGPRHAGVDWSWEHHAVCVLDDAGAVLERFMVKHEAAGLKELCRRLRALKVHQVAIERPDGPAVQALLDDGFEVVVIASRQVKALRLRYGSAGNKDDRFDAYVLADVLRTDGRRLRPVRPDSEATRALRALVRARKDLIKHRLALANQLRANLLQAFPGAIGLFAELDSPISLTFLKRFPTAERAARLTERRLQAWLRSVGYAGRRPTSRLLEHLRDAPAGLTGDAGEGHGIVTAQLVDLLTRVRSRIEVLDERIREALELHPDGVIFTSFPRAGTNRAALLLAEIGDCRERFPDEASLAAAAGVAPSTRASGKHWHVTFRRGCNKKLREALIDFAQDSVQASPWAEDIYRRARERGMRHPHAARVLARAWVRVLWRCWTDRLPYDPSRHAGFNRLQEVPA